MSYRSRKRNRMIADTLLGAAIAAFSIAILVVAFGSAAYCDYSPSAIENDCGQTLYNLISR